MTLNSAIEKDFFDLWPNGKAAFAKLKALLAERQEHPALDWTSRTVYALYVDLFASDFEGLKHKLDYLEDMGIGALWLLPILKSPMRDYGFDVADYFEIRPELLNGRTQALFYEFLDEARLRDIAVLFDIPLNHCSAEHPLFRRFQSEPESIARDYFIVSEDGSEYADCRILFKGMMESNWESLGADKGYYFHRFYEFQPDWNWRNPRVFLHALEALLFWRRRGVAGFRLDAIPFLWKEEGTDCENLEKTHTIVRLLRSCLDEAAPHTLLLAEACQPQKEVMRYFGEGDEVHAAYHFPLMPRLWEALAKGLAEPVQKVLEETPDLPEGCHWFVFLRCHDELTLEMVDGPTRKYLHDTYCKNPVWDFREGEGISARMMELLDQNPDRMLLAFSLLLSQPGIPVLYYGDELGLLNDKEFYAKTVAASGHSDSRNYVRGPVPWVQVTEELKDPNSVTARIHDGVAEMVLARRRCQWKDLAVDTPVPSVLRYTKQLEGYQLHCVHNLSSQPVELSGYTDFETGLCRKSAIKGDRLTLESEGYAWLIHPDS